MIIGILNILKIFIPPVSNLIASILRKKEEIGGFFINFYQGIIINIVIKKLLVLNIYLNIYFLIKLVLEIFKLPANISTAYPNVKIIKKIKMLKDNFKEKKLKNFIILNFTQTLVFLIFFFFTKKKFNFFFKP